MRCAILVCCLLCVFATLTTTAASGEGVQGVICTMTRDETKHLQEWVQFHLLVGATRIVIYDDRSDENMTEALAPFGDSVVVHDLFNMTEVPLEWLQPGRKPFIQRKLWAIQHCSKVYGGADKKGWMTIMDVDEFIFPCNRNSNATLWDAFSPRVSGTNGNATGIKLQCLKFGFNDMNRPLAPGQLMVQYHTRRAPYTELEPHIESWARTNLTKCRKHWCFSSGSHKTMYRLDIAPAARPGIHHPGDGGLGRLVNTTWTRTSSVCCNHYMLRSADELWQKSTKTDVRFVYSPLSQEDPRKWYRTVHDTLIWQYLPDLRQALQQKGIPVVDMQ